MGYHWECLLWSQLRLTKLLLAATGQTSSKGLGLE
jgi:hypothetical protein